MKFQKKLNLLKELEGCKMVQCFILNEERSTWAHRITVLYQFNNADYKIDDFLYTKKYHYETKEFESETIFINRDNLKNMVNNPKLKLVV